MMTGLDPAIILSAHHMAVGAGRGIILKVRISFGIYKGIAADANAQANCNTE